jgi:succinate dehydrogenase / fumarate reductase flavoprotein subunit
MPRYAPNAKDLASRDVVSRAMTMEIREGRGIGPDKDHINLHLEHLDAKIIHERLPGIAETAKTFVSIDVTQEPIPVIPTVHYNMGGIPTNIHAECVDLKDGNPETVVPGLMAIGEAACVSVHGANRLGSNSLLDLIVFGRAAAKRCAQVVKQDKRHAPLPAHLSELLIARFDRLRHANGGSPTAQLRDQMQRTMQEFAAVFRTQESLDQGTEKIRALVKAFNEDIRVTDRSMIWNTDLCETYELAGLLVQSLVTVESARNRTESRGAHAREDYPERDDENWLKHTLSWLEQDNQARFDYRPVHLNTLTDEVETIALKARTY